MKYSKIIGFVFLFCSSISFGQHLNEQEWAILSKYIASNDVTGFETYLKKKDFTKAEETNPNYTFYNWKEIEPFYYGVRVNKASKQVTFMTNDQNHVLKLLSRFVSEYQLIKSDKQGEKVMLHIFQSPNGTIAVKLDIASDSGTHLLLAVNKS